MAQEPYFIYGKPLFLQYWLIGFEIKEDLLHVLPLWIQLMNVRIRSCTSHMPMFWSK